MRRLHENRFYRDEALTPENITTIFEAFGWTSIRDWMGRDDDLTFVKGSDRISFDYNPRAGYDFIYYKDFDKNEYSSDYMMYAGVNCAELENDCRDFDKLQTTDFLKYKTPQLFMLGDSKPVPVLTESRLRRARLQEADKSRFIIPVWNEVDERGLWSDVKRSAGYGLVMCDLITSAIDKNDLEVLTFDYNLYKKMKKEIKEDAEKFVKDSGWRFDKKTQDKINKKAGKKINESEEEDVTPALTAEELNKLNNSETMIVYRSMQYINGELLPPMSAKTKLGMRKGSKLGEWEKAEEHPELANDAGYFPLNKGNGKTIMARYNPYFHCASDMLNDQFSSACDRPNMVTVECEIPVFELDSGYKAFKAKDAVGLQKWKCGIVQCQFKAKRDVYLSRYIKPIRVLSNDEVADHIVQEVAGYDITFPSNVVTPDLKEKLEARDIQFVNTNTDGIILEGDNAGKHYSKVYGGKKSKRLGESQAAYRASLVYPDEEDAFFDTVDEFSDTYEDTEEQLREDWEFILDTVQSIDPSVIESLRDIDINYVDTIVDRNDNERVAEFDPIQLSLNVSDIYFRLKPNIAAGVLLHELGHAVIVARYIRGGNGADLVKYAEDCKGHNQEWVDLCKQFEGCFKNVKVPITLNLSDPSIYAQTR